jgi:hypothetical protein
VLNVCWSQAHTFTQLGEMEARWRVCHVVLCTHGGTLGFALCQRGELGEAHARQLLAVDERQPRQAPQLGRRAHLIPAQAPAS